MRMNCVGKFINQSRLDMYPSAYSQRPESTAALLQHLDSTSQPNLSLSIVATLDGVGQCQIIRGFLFAHVPRARKSGSVRREFQLTFSC